MKLKSLFLTAAIVLAAACSTNTGAPTAIKVDVPARPAGQEDVIGLTVPAMDTVRVGFVGLGMRGSDAVVSRKLPDILVTQLLTRNSAKEMT